MAARTKKFFACASIAMALLMGAVLAMYSSATSHARRLDTRHDMPDLPRPNTTSDPELFDLTTLDHPQNDKYQTSSYGFFESSESLSRRDWSGLNWTSCHLGSECQNTSALSCPHGEYVIGWDRYYCPFDGEYSAGLPICCPIDVVPRQCIWRGGEHGNFECDGQCYDGEVTLVKSHWGGGNTTTSWNTGGCRGGSEKLFCCASDRWYNAIKDCFLADCGEQCPDRLESITQVFDEEKCEPEVAQQYCCPAPPKFSGCKWAGSAECMDNYCGDRQIQLMTHAFGDQPSRCLREERNKVFCCDTPEDQTFLPFDSITIIPENSPTEDSLAWDAQVLDDSEPEDGQNLKDAEAFGMLVIEGPSSVVSSARVKRDGTASDLHFLDCAQIGNESRYTARFVCLADDLDHDCHDMLEGGVEGTILEMPKGCGSGDKYGVVHSLALATNQTLPARLASIRNQTVMELEFDYNFGLVKRDEGDIFFRLDYSNVEGYWQYAIDEAPSNAKLKPRQTANEAAWHQIFEVLMYSAGAIADIGRVFSLDLEGTQFLYSNAITCADGSTGFCRVKLDGVVNFGTFVAVMIRGKLAPEPEVLQAFAYSKDHIDTQIEIEHLNNGHLNTERMTGMLAQAVFDQYSHAGIVTIGRTAQVDVAFEGHIDFNGNVSTSMHTNTATDIQQGFPAVVADQSGLTSEDSLSFRASIADNRESGYTKISVIPRMFTDFSLNRWPSDSNTVAIASQFEAFFEHYSIFETSDTGSYKVSAGVEPARGWVSSPNEVPGEISQWKEPDSAPRTWGGVTYLEVGSDLVGSMGNYTSSEPILADASAVFSPEKPDSFTCLEVASEGCLNPFHSCAWNICDSDPDYFGCNDDEDGFEDIPGTNVLSRRPYVVTFSDGTTLTIFSQDYPSSSELFKTSNAQGLTPRVFTYNNSNCGDFGISKPSIDPATWDYNPWVTEHILELQTIKIFLEVIESGVLVGGRPLPVPRAPSSWFLANWNSAILPTPLGSVWPYNDPPQEPNIPNDRVFESLGSRYSRRNFVMALKEINSIKVKIWSQAQPRAKEKFAKDVDAWLRDCKDAGAFLKYLKATRAVFSYMDDFDVSENFWKTVSNVHDQLNLIEGNVPGSPELANAWDYFITDFLEQISITAQAWMSHVIETAQQQIEEAKQSGKKLTVTPEKIVEVSVLLLQYKTEIGNMWIKGGLRKRVSVHEGTATGQQLEQHGHEDIS